MWGKIHQAELCKYVISKSKFVVSLSASIRAVNFITRLLKQCAVWLLPGHTEPVFSV